MHPENKISKYQIKTLEFPIKIQYFLSLYSKKSYQVDKQGQTDLGICCWLYRMNASFFKAC